MELHASPFLIPAVQHMTDLWSKLHNAVMTSHYIPEAPVKQKPMRRKPGGTHRALSGPFNPRQLQTS